MSTQDLAPDLSTVAALVLRAQQKAVRAQALVQVEGFTERHRAGAAEAARDADQAATSALTRLLSIGATLPDLSPPREDLADLAALESVRPDAQALAARLRALLPLAERIDAARGRSLPEPVAGSAGLDLAEDLAQLLARIELDLYGPGAALTGARE